MELNLKPASARTRGYAVHRSSIMYTSEREQQSGANVLSFGVSYVTYTHEFGVICFSKNLLRH